jgi:hypothetical protein
LVLADLVAQIIKMILLTAPLEVTLYLIQPQQTAVVAVNGTNQQVHLLQMGVRAVEGLLV